MASNVPNVSFKSVFLGQPTLSISGGQLMPNFCVWLSSPLPGVVNRTFGNRTQYIELQSFDWLRSGSVIELQRTHPKILPIEHNLTRSNVRKSNSLTIEHNRTFENRTLHATIEQKTSFIWFETKGVAFKLVMYWLQFQTRVRKDVPEGGKTILETLVKGYHECLLSPSVSVKSLLLRRKGEIASGPALKVTDDGRG